MQELPKAVRERITINGSPTDELDFKSLHATMLYHMKGLQGSPDAYDIFPDAPDRWTLRKCVKLAFNRIINSENWKQAKGSIRECFNRDNPELGKTLKRHFKTAGAEDENEFVECLISIIIKAHQPIKEYFCSGIWKELQRIDADIMLLIISRLRSMNIPALPVHDSIIVRKQDASIAHDVMLSAYKTGFRQEIIIEGLGDAA